MNTKRTLAALIVVLLVFPVALVAQGRPFQLEGLDGDSLTPGDFGQGAMIVVVWASWSPHCRDIDKRVAAIAGRWGSQADVIMVNFQEDRAEAEAFLAGKQVDVPVYLDQSGDFSKEHSVTNLPGLLVFKDGNPAFSGKLSRNPDSVISQALE